MVYLTTMIVNTHATFNYFNHMKNFSYSKENNKIERKKSHRLRLLITKKKAFTVVCQFHE